jgi:hypothetical protein
LVATPNSPPRKSAKHHFIDHDFQDSDENLRPHADRLCASQPAIAFKNTGTGGITRTPSINHSSEKVDGFGGFTQPAQVNK